MATRSLWPLICLAMTLLGAGCAEVLGLDEEPEFVVGNGGMAGAPCKDAPECPEMGGMSGTGGICNGQSNCLKDNGAPCSTNDDCSSHFCVDGVCCEKACDQKCMSCAVNGSAGSCVAVPVGESDPTGISPCLAPNACNKNGECIKGNGQACGGDPECSSNYCVDGVCCENKCDAICVTCNDSNNAGTCMNLPPNQDDPGACSGTSMACDGSGQCKLGFGQPCSVDNDCAMGTCNGGICTGFSCNGLSPNCGPLNETCCVAPLIPGGTYNRSNDTKYPATVSNFRLDRFEVTVGRFRRFFAAYPASIPAAGAGAHPLIPGSGWSSAMSGYLPPDQQSLTTFLQCSPAHQTWTPTPGSKENLPINCIDWNLAFAFCAWDGGRLPTEAEWNYAAAAGNQQREYPWSSPASSQTIDASYAIYNSALLQVVGSKSPKGDGKWLHADLAGSVWEWSLDSFQSIYANPCVDCANTSIGTYHVFRGGGWGTSAFGLLSSQRFMGAHADDAGIRCARDP